MARIAGIDIPREKRVEIALTYIYGIGLTRSKLILSNTGVNPDIRVKDLSDSDVQKLRGATEDFTVEGDLRRHPYGEITSKTTSHSDRLQVNCPSI